MPPAPSSSTTSYGPIRAPLMSGMRLAGSGATLPQAGDAVHVENVVVGDDRQVLDLRLRDEHAIERIAMITREPAGALRVEDRNIEALEALARQTPWNVSRHV